MNNEEIEQFLESENTKIMADAERIENLYKTLSETLASTLVSLEMQ